MAIFTGGTIPTIKVSSNTLVNSAVTGLAGNLADTTLSVALSPVLGAQLSSQLGLDPTASFQNLGSIVSNGVVSAGQQYLNQVIDQSIVNSDALGPFGPLVGGLAQNAVGAIGQGISGLLSGQGFSGFGGLAGLFGGGAGAATPPSAPNTTASRAFPGGDDAAYGDADANYGGSVYSLGSGGADVTFTIQRAVAGASADAAASIANPTAPALASLTESFSGAIGDFNLPTDTITTAFSGGLDVGGVATAAASSAFSGTSFNFAAVGGAGIGAFIS